MADPNERGASASMPHEHRMAQALAVDAATARSTGNSVLAAELYAQAAELESLALSAIPPSKRRTIGILGASVASLFYHAREFAKAKQVASDLLQTELLPSARAELEQLIAAIVEDSSPSKSIEADKGLSSAQRPKRAQRTPPSRHDRSPLSDRLRNYLTPSAPLGPSDAAQIHDVEVAARLFDPHNRSFVTLLRRDLSVLVGRRGSGKTALLNSYLYRPFIDRYTNPPVHGVTSDYRAYDLVIAVETYKHFDNMQRLVVGDPTVFRPVEAVVDDWESVVCDYFFAKLVDEGQQQGESSEQLKGLLRYLHQDDTDYAKRSRELVWGVSLLDRLLQLSTTPRAGNIRWTRQDALQAAFEHLRAAGRRALIIFDSMDEYDIGSPVFNRTLAALIRFITQFNARQESVAIKLVLPSEVLPEITRASANPLKDLTNIDRLIWAPAELAQLAAHRFRLFLELYAPDVADDVVDLDLNRRADLRTFWGRFLPSALVNRYGSEEDSLTYVFRHTQLLPRQCLMILQRAIVTNYASTGGYRSLSSAAIVEAVEFTESFIASEILHAFGHVYPTAEALCRPVFANFPTVFSYDELEDKWRKRGRPVAARWALGFDTADFGEMLLRMGIVGLSSNETERYHEGKFAYDAMRPVNIGEGHALCLHPIFGRHFNAAGNRHRKAVVPEGLRGVSA
ncbi:MAG: GTPase domain-containing protein [Thermoanaerobaculia bacterium]